jgi:hypothetical protein
MLKTKMNPEVKQKWIDALRSGKYEQGSGKLRIVALVFCVTFTHKNTILNGSLGVMVSMVMKLILNQWTIGILKTEVSIFPNP